MNDTANGAERQLDGRSDGRPDRAAVERSIDRLFRQQAGQMVATLSRYLGIEQLQLAEDSVQEALVTALRLWPFRGVPERPEAWLFKVARNRALDELRRRGNWSQKAERLRHELPVAEPPASVELGRGGFEGGLQDDQLAMIFACCHPDLPIESQLALTLKVVCSFSVAEIGRALLSRESAVAQRIVRAKKQLRARHERLEIPSGDELDERLGAALRVLYLLFNEGYSSSSGDDLLREGLCAEALRLATLLAEHPRTALPATHALTALLHFQASRFATRVDAQGDLLLIEQQDRSAWNRQQIERGVRALGRAATGTALTSYHLEAEISACHALASDFSATDWPRMLECYDALVRLHPSPIVEVNRLIPVARVRGVAQALELSSRLIGHPKLVDYYPARVAHGELLAESGRPSEAAESFRTASSVCSNEVVRRHLERRVCECEARSDGVP